MDFIKSQYGRIQQQLSGLTPSQKMLSVALVVIIVMTLWWWGNYAGTSGYEPMLTQKLSPDEIAVIAAQLRSSAVEHKVVGTQIMVPQDKMFEAVAHVGYADVLPKSMASGFDEMIKQLTPWDGADRQNAIFNHGKELSLQRIISHFPNVASATVLIDPAHKRNLSVGGNLEPTATVNVTMRSGHPADMRLASSCAHLVAGAVAGLEPSRVNVVINGQTLRVPDQSNPFGGMAASSIIDAQRLAEQHENEKLERHLRDIPGVRVSVTVRIDSASESVESLEVEDDKSGIFRQKAMSMSTDGVNATPDGGDAAMVPHVVMSIANGPATAGPQNWHTEKRSEKHATKKVQRTKPAGDHTVIAASVRVPRSYLVYEAKAHAITLDAAIARLLPTIRAAVAASAGLTQPEAITVEPYTDYVSPPPQTEVATASGVSLLLGGHVKEITLGGLALASLFMMSMIVRRGAAIPAPITAQAGPSGFSGPQGLTASKDPSGEAIGHASNLGDAGFDDDKSAETRQMLTQVTALVADRPDAAAQLIKRWMNQR